MGADEKDLHVGHIPQAEGAPGAPLAPGLVPVAAGGAGAIIQAMHGGAGLGAAIPTPFSHPICLVPSTRVAGTTHVEGIDELASGLAAGERLVLVRDKDNRYDAWSIKVSTAGGRRLGYVAADVSEIPARLMDGGKALYGEVNVVEKVGGWWRIGMGVWLDD
jgi:hypothetical protein